MTEPLLDIANLTVTYAGGSSAVEGFDLRIERGVRLGLVGESGSGKSSIVKAILGLIYPPHEVKADQMGLEGVGDLGRMSIAEMRAVRGRSIGYIGQNPFGALHPVVSVGRQFEGFLRDHRSWEGSSSERKVASLLTDLGIADPERVLQGHAGALSGGMAQRVAIALASLLAPDLVIADEPTTALDVTVQRQVLDLIAHPRSASGQSLLLVTHDLAVVAQYCDDVVVMQHGKVVERGRVESVFTRPEHPYTAKLLGSVPDTVLRPEPASAPPALHHAAPGPDVDRTRRVASGGAVHAGRAIPAGEPVLVIEGVSKTFGRGRTSVDAVCDVSLTIGRGETVALVGESGSGKSTLGRLATMLERPDAGRVVLEGTEITGIGGRQVRQLRSRMQTVFQEPYQSLDPQLRVRTSVAEPLTNLRPRLSRSDMDAKVTDALVLAGLDPEIADRFPHQLSGGQQQRAGIARAIVTRPAFVVLDEPTSSLDLTVRAAIVAQLQTLQDELGISYLFISHDLATAQQIADRIAVMYKGRIVESGPARRVLAEPLHPYTETLSDACLDTDPRVAPRPLRLPVSAGPATPGACSFLLRCPRGAADCDVAPELGDAAPGRRIACHHPVLHQRGDQPTGAGRPTAGSTSG